MATGHRITSLIGERFGRLVVVEKALPDKNGRTRWLCKCDCSREKVIADYSLRRGATKSCNCLSGEMNSLRRKTHGATESAEYKVWCGIKRRCLNPNDKAYPRYGAKGITICDRWKDSFENFLKDVGERPSPQHEIDRYPNQQGNYEPGNVRWATDKEQSQNRSSNHYVTFNGVTRCLIEWERETGIKGASIAHRLRAGWPLEDALTIPATRRNRRPL